MPADDRHVSRETDDAVGDAPEPVPDAATQVFGDRLGLAVRYAGHLCTTGVQRGLLGPREVPRIWSRHILNCGVLQELLPHGASVIDVGSGAGLPGLVLAIARPDLQITLVEPFERRTTWLTEVAEDLELPVRVVRARAEEVAGAEQADFVTARAVAPLDRLAAWGLPLVRPEGELLAIKGRTAQDEVDAAGQRLRRLGVVELDVLSCGVGLVEPPTTVVRARVGPDGARGPRHAGGRTGGAAPGGTGGRAGRGRAGSRPRRRR